MKHEWEWRSGVLKHSVNHLIHKIENGFFNIILVIGATRVGKSTIAMQIGDHMAKNLGVPFTHDHVYFDASQLEKDCKGKKRGVFMLDEAAFDLTGEDWAKDAQKKLKTYFSVAAKYNQTFIIIIPHIEELRKFFVINEHTRGLEVTYNRKTLKRGTYKMYSTADLRSVYYLRKMNHYGKASTIGAFKGEFPDKIPENINMAVYQRKKDDAIENQDAAADTNTKRAYIERALKLGMPTKDICFVLNTVRNYVYSVKNNSTNVK